MKLMYSYEFTRQAAKDLKKLPKDVQQTIVKKLDYFINSGEPLQFATYLINSEIGQYRFRIGDYRVIFDLENEILIILTLGHRKEIYR